ncbi:MAG: hypothetical protein EA380_06005 [Phycisphaeraceae bacterium]|nr:MAG: hypothetical protein EA380_06005 [Phycisphaeraceae bacterium]
MSIGGLLLLGIAVVMLFILRKNPTAMCVHVPGVGRISTITSTISALALVGIGYHLLVHGLHIPQFRAPLRIAVFVAVLAVVGSLMVDVAENRLDAREGVDEEQP